MYEVSFVLGGVEFLSHTRVLHTVFHVYIMHRHTPRYTLCTRLLLMVTTVFMCKPPSLINDTNIAIYILKKILTISHTHRHSSVCLWSYVIHVLCILPVSTLVIYCILCDAMIYLQIKRC